MDRRNFLKVAAVGVLTPAIKWSNASQLFAHTGSASKENKGLGNSNAVIDDKNNVRNNPDQIPNRKAADIVESSELDYTVLRPGYLRDGEAEDYTLTFKGEQAKGYVSTLPSVVGLAIRLIKDDTLYVRQSVSITREI